MSKKFIIVALSGTLAFTGCQSFTSSPTSKAGASKKSSWFPWAKKEYQNPESMAVIWKEDTIYVPGKAPTRGFGGRVYFYNAKSQAVPVDGELTVYGYDETTPNPAKQHPDQADKKFKFTAEQFTQHFSESQLGASYSIWIPWDEANGNTKKISLIPTFVTKDGKLVRGEPSKQVLLGKNSGSEPAPQNPQAPQVRAVGYNEVVTTTNTNGGANSMKTTTIGVPSQMAQRLTQPNMQQPMMQNQLAADANAAANVPIMMEQQAAAEARVAQIFSMLQQMNEQQATPTTTPNPGILVPPASAVQPASATQMPSAVQPASGIQQPSMVQPAANFQPSLPQQQPMQSQVVPAFSSQPFSGPIPAPKMNPVQPSTFMTAPTWSSAPLGR